MKKIKEWASLAGGSFGVILMSALPILLYIIPISALGLQFWVSLLILVVFYFFDVIGTIGMWVAYVIGFIRLWGQPITFFSIVFYIFFAANVIWIIVNLISSRKTR